MARSMRERLMTPAKQWAAVKEGDFIFGEMEAIEERSGDYGPFFLVTVLAEEGVQDGKAIEAGPHTVAFIGKVLQNRAVSYGFAVGADVDGLTLGVVYDGEQKSKTPGFKPTKVYRTQLQGGTVGAVTAGGAATATPAAAAAEVADELPGEEPF